MNCQEKLLEYGLQKEFWFNYFFFDDFEPEKYAHVDFPELEGCQIRLKADDVYALVIDFTSDVHTLFLSCPESDGLVELG